MFKKEYEEQRLDLLNEAFGVSRDKGNDYTVGSEDVLANFKSVARKTGLDPKQVLFIYMDKHQDAIANYIKNNGQSESEPIRMRIIDNINYLCLLWGLIQDEHTERKSEGEKASAVDRPQTINILPDADGEGYSVYLDGGKRSRYTPVGESLGTPAVRYRSEESGKVERLVEPETSGRELRGWKDTTFGVQKKS